MFRSFLVGRFLIAVGLLAPLPFKAGAQSRVVSEGASGQQLFSSTCSGCHGLDGHGGEHGPNIATDANIQGLSGAGLARIIRNGVPGSGMPAFRSSFDDGQISALVSYLRFLQEEAGTGSLAGDSSRGRLLFFGAARCAECHMANGQGGFIGPDLSGYGKTHSPAAIREAILDPDKDADPLHGTVVAITHAGRKYIGVVRNEDNFSLQMQTVDGNFHLFEKSALVRIEHPARSLMPADYGLKLTASQLSDLVSFLVKNPGAQSAERDGEDDQ